MSGWFDGVFTLADANYLVAQLTEQLTRVQFAAQIFMTRVVTDWVSGIQSNIQFQSSFDQLTDAIAVTFGMEIVRIYALQSPNFQWKGKLLLTAENFNDYISR